MVAIRVACRCDHRGKSSGGMSLLLDQFPNAVRPEAGLYRGDDLGSTGQIELGHPWRQ